MYAQPERAPPWNDSTETRPDLSKRVKVRHREELQRDDHCARLETVDLNQDPHTIVMDFDCDSAFRALTNRTVCPTVHIVEDPTQTHSSRIISKNERFERRFQPKQALFKRFALLIALLPLCFISIKMLANRRLPEIKLKPMKEIGRAHV